MLNEMTFIKEFTNLVKDLDFKNALEIGCLSGELISAIKDLSNPDKEIDVIGIDLNPKVDGVIKADIRDYKSRKKFDLVFSSGLLQLFSKEEVPEIIKNMAALSKEFILNYVPNSNCNTYMDSKSKTDAPWKVESDYNLIDFVKSHTEAGLEVVSSGLAGKEWANKFGSNASEPYLVWVLAKKVK